MLHAILLLVSCQASAFSILSLSPEFVAIKDQQSEFYRAIRDGAEEDLVHAATLKGFEEVCYKIAERLEMSNRSLKSRMPFLYQEDGNEHVEQAQSSLKLDEPKAYNRPDSLLQAEKRMERETQRRLFEANKALYLSMRAAHRAEIDQLNQRLEDMRAYGPVRTKLFQHRLVAPARDYIVGLTERARASAQTAVSSFKQEVRKTAHAFLTHRRNLQDASVVAMFSKKAEQPAKACSSEWQEMSSFVND